MTEAVKSGRIESIDLARGMVMIFMALDHTRDFLTKPGLNPTDLAVTTIPLFFTRWITHFCAPVFFLLVGVGARLYLRRNSKPGLTRFLVTRGLWLIFLDVVVLRCLAFQFNFDFHVTLLLVLWALGWSMIVLSALIYMPDSWVTAFGVVMIATHNLLDNIQSTNPLWSILHAQQIVFATPGHVVFVAYPLIPWIGVTAAGYGLGKIYNEPAERRRAILLRLGIGLTAAFIALRALNRYGDPRPWSSQKSPVFTLLSFLNTTKYPASLLFLLMTLGPALLFLWVFDGRTPRLLRPALVFGKVPMFYYVLHLPLIHLLAVVICYARYGAIHWMFESPTLGQVPFTPPPGWGLSLPQIYLAWIFVVCALYPPCCWFANVKRRRSDPWLSYF
jgi:uncharacterized membrane protein